MTVGLILGAIAYAFFIAGGLLFLFTSLLEQEKQAAVRAGLLSLCAAALPVIFFFFFPNIGKIFLLTFLGIAVAGLVMLLMAPRPRKQLLVRETPRRVDERDIIFARFDLEKDTPAYQEYYTRRPEFRALDDRIRALPDILSAAHCTKDTALFALANAEFEFLEGQLRRVDGPVQISQPLGSAQDNTRLIKKIVHYLGADLVGICALDPAYVYTHVGRGPETYGAKIELHHSFAVVFAVQMSFAAIAEAPRAPVIVETARQYVEAARISVVGAGMMRRMGYPARAHMAGSNYAAIVPPLAWMAGLGELGRIGFLVTRKYGPRVRLGLITTDMPLLPDHPETFGVQDFCRRCKKCAQNCPSQAIPRGNREFDNGVLRWVIDREACYTYWRMVGTDCARCIYVCPYSMPDSFMHNAVRWAASRSAVAQILAVKADDLIYGRHPKPHSRGIK